MTTPQLPLSAISVGSRHRRDLGDLKALAASINDVGLLHPIVVTPDGRLIAGQRRLAAVQLLGWEVVPIHVVNLAEIIRGEWAENSERLALAPTELVAIEAALAPLLAAEARERQREHGGTAPGRPADTSANFAEVKGEARDKVARYAGVSREQLRKAKAVVQAAEREPERYQDLVDRMDETRRVDGPYRELNRRETWQGRTAVPPPAGLFRTLVIDPPWPYENRRDDGTHRAALPYPDMTIDRIIAETPIPSAEDCHLWLWTTNAFLREAFRCLDAWGFTYRTMLTWAKPSFGAGDWLRGQTEHCLFASKGILRPFAGSASTLLAAPRGEHSEKPEAFYSLVAGLSPGPRIDMYGRKGRPGWAVWGNETGFIPAGDS